MNNRQSLTIILGLGIPLLSGLGFGFKEVYDLSKESVFIANEQRVSVCVSEATKYLEDKGVQVNYNIMDLLCRQRVANDNAYPSSVRDSYTILGK